MSSRSDLFSTRDAGSLVGLPLLAAIAVGVPPRHWNVVSKKFAFALRLGWGHHPLNRIISTFPTNNKKFAENLLTELASNEIQNLMWLLRIGMLHRQSFFSHLQGSENIDSALQSRKGVIFWQAHFSYSSLFSKIILSNNSYGFHHLSHPRHGISESVFGKHILNKLVHMIESRFVASREQMNPGNPASSLRTLLRLLSFNEIVSVTSRSEAVKPISVPFLSGQLTIAPGAADLAYL